VDDVKDGAGGNLAAVTAMNGGRQEPDADLHLLERQWLQAEHALYPMIFAQPDAYETSVRLVRAVAEGLRDASAPHDLADAWRGRRGLVLRAARGTGISLEDVDAGRVGGAGFCFRLRQLQAESRQTAQGEPVTGGEADRAHVGGGR
jgi:acetyl esterase/lipase